MGKNSKRQELLSQNSISTLQFSIQSLQRAALHPYCLDKLKTWVCLCNQNTWFLSFSSQGYTASYSWEVYWESVHKAAYSSNASTLSMRNFHLCRCLKPVAVCAISVYFVGLLLIIPLLVLGSLVGISSYVFCPLSPTQKHLNLPFHVYSLPQFRMSVPSHYLGSGNETYT